MLQEGWGTVGAALSCPTPIYAEYQLAGRQASHCSCMVHTLYGSSYWCCWQCSPSSCRTPLALPTTHSLTAWLSLWLPVWSIVLPHALPTHPLTCLPHPAHFVHCFLVHMALPPATHIVHPFTTCSSHPPAEHNPWSVHCSPTQLPWRVVLAVSWPCQAVLRWIGSGEPVMVSWSQRIVRDPREHECFWSGVGSQKVWRRPCQLQSSFALHEYEYTYCYKTIFWFRFRYL